MPSYDKTVEFYLTDHPRTLFPLETNRFLVENYASELGGFVYERITHKKDGEIAFLPQTRAYAAKPHLHLRRTAKLDPVAEFFLYDLIYRNRTGFTKRAVGCGEVRTASILALTTRLGQSLSH